MDLLLRMLTSTPFVPQHPNFQREFVPEHAFPVGMIDIYTNSPKPRKGGGKGACTTQRRTMSWSTFTTTQKKSKLTKDIPVAILVVNIPRD